MDTVVQALSDPSYPKV